VLHKILGAPQSDPSTTAEDIEGKFGALLHGLSLGCPLHCGIALGMDRLCSCASQTTHITSHVFLRLVALVCNAASLRDVVAFPKTELLTGSPASVSDAALKEYHIKIVQ
jgi:aspartyl-tRNA synthetase